MSSGGGAEHHLHLTDWGPDFTETFLAPGQEIYGCYASVRVQ